VLFGPQACASGVRCKDIEIMSFFDGDCIATKAATQYLASLKKHETL
jgi:hypothetical protein